MDAVNKIKSTAFAAVGSDCVLREHQTGRAVAGMRTLVAGAAILLGVVGCAGKTHQTTNMGAIPNPAPQPTVIGGDSRDTAAFAEARKSATQVEWGVMEKQGPKPIWRRVGSNGDSKATASAPGFKESDKALTAETASERAAAAATQAATQPIEISTPLTPIDELPVHIVDLPDGKVRIIWTLRSYGGSVVTSARDAGTSRRTVTISPGDLAPLTAVLTAHVGPTGVVAPLAKENVLVITCDKPLKDSVLALLDEIDVPPRQVQITAKIFEVSRDFDFQQGAQLLAQRLSSTGAQTAASTFSAQKALEAASAATPFQGTVLNLMETFSNAGISLDATFQLMADVGLIKVVSEPRMTVATGQTGYMLAGQELPIQSASFVNNAIQTTTQYKPVGVQLYITPQAIGGDRVKLHAISVVSSVSGFTQLPTLTTSNTNSGLINPIIDSREAETAVTIQDGSTLVISGLRMVRTTTRENKVPGLGDVPVLGWLFKNHRSQQQMTDLYFFVTPTLL